MLYTCLQGLERLLGGFQSFIYFVHFLFVCCCLFFHNLPGNICDLQVQILPCQRPLGGSGGPGGWALWLGGCNLLLLGLLCVLEGWNLLFQVADSAHQIAGEVHQVSNFFLLGWWVVFCILFVGLITVICGLHGFKVCSKFF